MDEHSGLASQEFERARATFGKLVLAAAEAVMSLVGAG